MSGPEAEGSSGPVSGVKGHVTPERRVALGLTRLADLGAGMWRGARSALAKLAKFTLPALDQFKPTASRRSGLRTSTASVLSPAHAVLPLRLQVAAREKWS
jgi:hypothetical protein